MKTSLLNIVLFTILPLLIITSLILYVLMDYAYGGNHFVSIETAREHIKNKKYNVILDVRTQLEYNMGHFPTSLNIPVASIEKRTLEQVIPNKDASILIYCNTGQRARYASEQLEKYGYKNIHYIAGTYGSLM